MPIYYVGMSDVKQESLANAKVRMARNSSACMKAPSEEIYGKSTQGT